MLVESSVIPNDSYLTDNDTSSCITLPSDEKVTVFSIYLGYKSEFQVDLTWESKKDYWDNINVSTVLKEDGQYRYSKLCQPIIKTSITNSTSWSCSSVQKQTPSGLCIKLLIVVWHKNIENSKLCEFKIY